MAFGQGSGNAQEAPGHSGIDGFASKLAPGSVMQ
jgi:hypothetical protein